MCHAAEQRLPVTPPVPSTSRPSVAASQDTPCIRHGEGWDQRTVSWAGQEAARSWLEKRESMKAASWAQKQERRLEGTVKLGTETAEAE